MFQVLPSFISPFRSIPLSFCCEASFKMLPLYLRYRPHSNKSGDFQKTFNLNKEEKIDLLPQAMKTELTGLKQTELTVTAAS